MHVLRVTLLLFITAFILSAFAHSAYAQETDFERWQREQQQAFDQFIDDENRRFADFLRKQWEAFEPLEGDGIPDPAPKPVNAPTAPDVPEEQPDEIPAEKPAEEKPEPQTDPSGEAVPSPPTPPSLPPPPLQAPPVAADPSPPEMAPPVRATPPPPENRFSWHYYEAPLPALSVSNTFSIPSLSSDTIADAWLEMAGSNYEEIIETLTEFSDEHALNEWAFLQLIKDYSRNVFRGHNESAFLSWFLLHNAGFHANAGYSENHLHLLMPVSERLYNQNYYSLSTELPRFYVMKAGHNPIERPGMIRTYEPEDNTGLRVLSMDLSNPPAPVAGSENQKLSFNFMGQTYSFDLSYDKAYTSILSTFPSMEPEYFFRAPASAELHNQLDEQLRGILQDMSTAQALDFLLRFSQTAFEYKTDTDQFGRQRYMTPDQILHYPYSDCDDRAIFFSYLVRHFLDLEVIGVSWPGHMATAVRTNEADGARLFYQDSGWLICDPTYINARAGMVMPDFQGLEATLHPFE